MHGGLRLLKYSFREIHKFLDARLKLSAAVGVASVGFDTCPICFVLRAQALAQVLPLRFRQVAGAAGERPHAGCLMYTAQLCSYVLERLGAVNCCTTRTRRHQLFDVLCL